MNFLKSGPELKLSELRMPTFLVDLYWDLRDRHLLPLLGLIVVAIVAVPFLLSGGTKPQPATGAGGLVAAPSPEAHSASLTVVEAKPGLRDYRKRLHDDTPTDPFVQRYTAPQLAGTKLGGGKGGSSSTSSTSTSKTTSSGGGAGGSEGSGSGGGSGGGSTTTTVKSETTGHTTSPTGSEGGGAQTEPQVTLYSFAIKVKITVTSGDEGEKQTSQPTIRQGVLPPSSLPGGSTQVVTYMGISPKTKKPLLLVSDQVTGVFGEGKCLSGAAVCQLLEVEPGFPETFVYGPSSQRYKINVLEVEPVVAGKY